MRITTNQIRGLLPALDARQVGAPFVVDGRNFYVSVRGPRTGFGGVLYSQTVWADPNHVQSLLVGSEVFYFASDGIYCMSSTLADFFYPIYMFDTPILTEGPWTVAYVGSKYYFCKPGSIVIQYDPVNYAWKEITTDVATGPVAVTQAGGRLIILAQGVVQWSEIDNGENLAVDPDLGIGAQLLAFIGGGTPLHVKEISDGFVTYTDRGVMHSQVLSGNVLAFRHRALQNDIIPIDRWGVVDIDRRVHIVLARTGFYLMSGTQAEPWNPLFGEYLRDQWLGELRGAELFYNPTNQLFFVALNRSTAYRTYERTFVTSMSRQEDWGVMNHPHYGLHRVAGRMIAQDRFINAYMQPDGYMFALTNDFSRELSDYDPCKVAITYSEYLPVYGADRFYSMAHITDIDPNQFASASGVYNLCSEVEYAEYSALEGYTRVILWNEPFTDSAEFTDDTGFSAGLQPYSVMTSGAGFLEYEAAIYTSQKAALDSWFTVGLFRVVGEEQIDRLNDFYELVVGTEDVGGRQEEIVDWQYLGGVEDWNLLSGREDWGQVAITASGYIVDVFGTYDGIDIFEGNKFTPEIRFETARSRTYQFDLTGYYFAVTIRADEVNYGTELRMLEIAGQLGGRL